MRLLVGFAVVGLIGVVVCAVWLAQRELQISEAVLPLDQISTLSDDLDGIRVRLYELRERYRRNAALDLSSKHSNAVTAAQSMQSWIESVALKLGESLRPDPPQPFKPEAFFVAYSPGSCRMKLVGWTLKGGSAAYTFQLSYSNSDLVDEVIPDVREGEAVGELRLSSSSSPTQTGKTYEETVRVTPRGKEIKRVVKLPDFRTLKLTLEQRKNASEVLFLEDAYSASDRHKAELSGRSFKDGIQWEIPLATIAIRDDPNAEVRSITVKEGSRFVFAGTEYAVRKILPDRIEVCTPGEGQSPQTWARAQ